MDDYTQDFYLLRFEVEFLKADGDAFQDLFATLMEAAFPGDFVRTRTWGNVGDRKNDGWRQSTSNLFQCYGPYDLGSTTTVAKMEEDFEGAIGEWDDMKVWTFVHNSMRGLPPDPLKKALELNARHDAVAVTIWGFPELLLVVREISQPELRRIFGAVPRRAEVADARFDELLPVLEQVASGMSQISVTLTIPPANKIERNDLSAHVARLLRVGTEGSEQVEAALRESPDATLGDRVASAFGARYRELRDEGDRRPDEIFFALQEFAGWGDADASRQGAILAVLAYLFERCDIFEGE